MSESSASSRIKHLLNTYSGLVLMGAVGIPVGVIVGAICALFGRVLLAIGAFRDEHITLLLPFRDEHITLLLPFLALIGSAIVFAYRTWGKGTDRGMSLVFDVGHGRKDAIRKARPVLSRRLGYARCSNVIPRTRPQAEAATPCGRGRRHIR